MASNRKYLLAIITCPTPNIGPYTCVPCKESFEYPSKYRQHIASRSHRLFVESLHIRQSSYTQPSADNEVSVDRLCVDTCRLYVSLFMSFCSNIVKMILKDQ